MRMWPLALMGLASCAAPACRQAVVQALPQVQVVEKVIVIHERPVHEALINDYQQALRSEQPVVLHSKAPVINQLIKLDAAARAAFAPIERAHHRATPAEISKAVAALGAVQAYVSQRHP